MPDIAPLVNALMELMTAKDELLVKSNQPGVVVYNAVHQREVKDLENKVVAAQNKVTQQTQAFQTALAAALQKP